MNPVKVSLDAKKRTVKPNDRDIKTISSTIHKNPVEIPLDTLADCAGNKGFTFAPAIFNGNRRAANVSEIQLICLDFDNKDLKISFDEALDRSEKLDLPIAFAYETFSSINRSKFRIVYRYFEPIVNQNFYKIIINILFELFPEADRAASDWSRIFFGGKKLLTDVNLKTIHPQRLFSSLYQHYSENTKTKVKNIEKFALSNNIELINNTFHTDIINIKTGTTLDEPVIYNKDNSNLFPDETFIIYQNNSKAINKKIQFSDTKVNHITNSDIYNGCSLLRDFKDGKRWLYYPEIWGILTNLIHIKGGKKYFKSIIDSLYNSNKSIYPYNYEKWYSNIKQITNCPYAPQRCENFCPYSDSCNHSKNIITTLKTHKNKITVLYNKINYISKE